MCHYLCEISDNNSLFFFVLLSLVCRSIGRAFTVQRVLSLPSLVLREPIPHALLSVMGLSVPLVVEAIIALAWDSKSPLEAARSVSTVEREPSLQYGNAILIYLL